MATENNSQKVVFAFIDALNNEDFEQARKLVTDDLKI
jgi:hypothetical protein